MCHYSATHRIPGNRREPTPTAEKPRFDRATQDVGNIVEFGHVNLRVPDQQQAVIFYVMGLGLTRDPFLRVGIDNAWMNIGCCQFHLPTGPAQVLRGVTGLVMPSLGCADGAAGRGAAVAQGHEVRIFPQR